MGCTRANDTRGIRRHHSRTLYVIQTLLLLLEGTKIILVFAFWVETFLALQGLTSRVSKNSTREENSTLSQVCSRHQKRGNFTVRCSKKKLAKEESI